MSRDHWNRIIITAGPTREWLDPVRFLSNPASGQTGWFLAEAARDSAVFQEVVYISGPGWPEYRSVPGALNYAVEGTHDMARVLQGELASNSILFMTAAPADYYLPQIATQKRKKNDGGPLQLELHPTPDILKSIIEPAVELENFWRIGFAAETNNVEEYALQKLQAKQLDFICANQVFRNTSGFGTNRNTLTVIGRDQSRQIIGPENKKTIARQLLQYILESIRAIASDL
ncbi:MAG: phosphopantothenoylcysteine decarboxylase [Leptospiraceae bacterium]|nr:phosphopantothenoylcysteine decarboxylase [Leptospiraceae bacterium]